MNEVLEAVKLIVNLNVILIVIAGTICGAIVGSLPGLSGTMAIAVVLPVTFYISPWLGIPLILAIYKSSQWAGAVGSIIINTPGNAAGAAMVLDGYPLKQQGHGQREHHDDDHAPGQRFSQYFYNFAHTNETTFRPSGTETHGSTRNFTKFWRDCRSSCR